WPSRPERRRPGPEVPIAMEKDQRPYRVLLAIEGLGVGEICRRSTSDNIFYVSVARASRRAGGWTIGDGPPRSKLGLRGPGRLTAFVGPVATSSRSRMNRSAAPPPTAEPDGRTILSRRRW